MQCASACMEWEEVGKGSLFYSFSGPWALEALPSSTQGSKTSLGIEIQLTDRKKKDTRERGGKENAHDF